MAEDSAPTIMIVFLQILLILIFKTLKKGVSFFANKTHGLVYPYLRLLNICLNYAYSKMQINKSTNYLILLFFTSIWVLGKWASWNIHQ